MKDRFDSLSPLDSRYWDEDVARHLSENGFTRAKLAVEMALVNVLHRRGLCDADVVREIEAACGQVTTEEVYAEEDKTKHDIRALVNCIQRRVSDRAKPYVHMTATSYDIVDTANALRYRAVVTEVVAPLLLKLEKTLIDLTLREAETVQIGRTHGQHAVPITFGFAMAGYVSRLGNSIENLRARTRDLVGKFSGAVGAYNASSLFFEDPDGFEGEVLDELGLFAAEHSTQIVPPEPMARLLSEMTVACGVMADLADDMRHLQRTEIGEVGEAFGADQVGSSTMPQKRNPINFENAKSMWKIVASRASLAFMDQLSEHQRDLTNSASARSYGEVFAYAAAIAKRLERTLKKLEVAPENLERNLRMQGELITAEPLYLLLAAAGHPDAHEKVRRLTQAARASGRMFSSEIGLDKETRGYIDRMSPHQREMLWHPEKYVGIAAKKAREVAKTWKERLEL